MSSTTLFSPFQLKNYTLKNRVGVAPMTRMSSIRDSVPRQDVLVSSIRDSVPRQDVLGFLVRRAENNAAIVFTEAIVTDYESAQGYPGQARMTTRRQIEAWQPVVRAMQKHGSIAIMQMFHCGRMAWPEVNPACPQPPHSGAEKSSDRRAISGSGRNEPV
jgi:2,4-dienoyl-CoA reductase-like NADH-dependent reductase (Old Yellow Enzyme family)